MKILCVGESLIEITCPINENVCEGQNLRIGERIECGGGSAGNISYLLGKWGIETYIASMLGADDAAEKIKKEYEAIGVKIDYLETSYDKSTNQSIVLLNNINKNLSTYKIGNNKLKRYAVLIEPDVIVSDGVDYNATMALFDKYSKAIKYLKVSFINNEVLELGKYVNYIIFNKDTAENLTNMQVDYSDSSSIVNIYNKLKQRFDKQEVIITLGEKGSVYAINYQIKIMPVINLDVVDTNGAGDVYTGAFIYSMSKGFGLEKAIAYATIASGLSVKKITSRMAIPNLIDVSNFYDSKFGEENNPNKEHNQENHNINMSIENDTAVNKVEASDNNGN